jgi:hypothetical protein
MYARPTIRKKSAPTEKVEQSYIEQFTAPKKGLTQENLEKLKPVFIKAVKRRRERFRRKYHLSKLESTLFNGDALAPDQDIIGLFDWITHEGDPDIEVASLKGGRFKELARYDAKGTIKFKGGGEPNQIGLGFKIDGKNNYVNIFSNGSIRFTGASDEKKVIDFINDYVGRMKYITFSNRSGQLSVDKELNLNHLAQSIEMTKDTRVIHGKSGLTVQFGYTENVKVPLEAPPARKTQGGSVVVHLGPEKIVYESIETRKKLFSLIFFKSGIIQYKGSFSDLGLIVRSVYTILDRAQKIGNVFIGSAKERDKKEKKKAVYKTRSSNPPNPPDSFEGKCAPGYYCRPNAQGFPTCYKIPTINESSRKTVIESYKGLQIPKSVKDIFKIGEVEEVEKPVKLEFEKQTYKGHTIDVLKIGGRQCSRLTEDQIEEVARKHQIPGVIKGMGIARMCAKIGASIIRSKEPKSNFELEGIKYYVEGEHIKGALRRNGKPNPGRKCATIPTETLYKYARAMGIDPTGKSKPQICKEMQSKKVPTRVVEVPEVVPKKKKVVDYDKNANVEQLSKGYEEKFKEMYPKMELGEKIKLVTKKWLNIDIDMNDYVKPIMRKVLAVAKNADAITEAKAIILAEQIMHYKTFKTSKTL